MRRGKIVERMNPIDASLALQALNKILDLKQKLDIFHDVIKKVLPFIKIRVGIALSVTVEQNHFPAPLERQWI